MVEAESKEEKGGTRGNLGSVPIKAQGKHRNEFAVMFAHHFRPKPRSIIGKVCASLPPSQNRRRLIKDVMEIELQGTHGAQNEQQNRGATRYVSSSSFQENDFILGSCRCPYRGINVLPISGEVVDGECGHWCVRVFRCQRIEPLLRSEPSNSNEAGVPFSTPNTQLPQCHVLWSSPAPLLPAV